MTGFVVYTRRGCHLCEVLIEELLEELGDEATPELRDIDTDSEWRAMFNTRVPVLEYKGDWICDYKLDRQRVRAILAGAGEDAPTAD